jgi:cell division protein FtsQ
MKRPAPRKMASQKIQQQQLARLARAPKTLTKRDLESSLVGRMISARRARRITASISVLAVIALIAITVAATYSPALALKQIYVSGNERVSTEQVLAALESHLGTPLALIGETDVASSLADFELIESFSVSAVPPDGLNIRIFERQPVSIVSIEGVGWLHDVAGVRIALANAEDKYPQVLISESPINSQRYRNAMEVLLSLPQQLLDDVETIEARSKDDVRLGLASNLGNIIIWGDSSNSALKAKVLEALMQNYANTAEVVFDVSSPNAPVVRLGNF